MVDIARVAAVPQRLHNPIDDTDLRLQLPQKKDPSITRRRAAVEVCFYFFPEILANANTVCLLSSTVVSSQMVVCFLSP